mgnify:CR=1 FL=1
MSSLPPSPESRKIFVGAYAASPCHSVWDPVAERRYLEGLAALPDIGGLEIPFHGSPHRFDTDWFLANLNPDWDYVLTLIPGTMETLAKSPHFGLASRAEKGRQEALNFAERALLAVRAINARAGRPCVRAVEIHSAPQLGNGIAGSSVEEFRDSLSELAAWDWQGAELMVEHCDRYIAGQKPAKGFLSVEQELEAITGATPGPTPVSMLINWGRSALETRDVEEPLRHLRLAREAGRLGGLIFSGCTIEDPLYGHWADSHTPFGGEGTPLATSLLTKSEVARCRDAADWDRLPVRGLKMQALPKDLDVASRVALVQSWVSFLRA